MSFKSFKQNKPSRQPAILSRKRKADSDLELSPPSDLFSSPSSSNMISSSCDNTPSPRADCEEKCAKEIMPTTFSEFRGFASMDRSFSCTNFRKSPLPDLNWAEQRELWHSFVLKDIMYPRDPAVLKNHPELDPRMWTILVDWLSEVCEVYRLHRETYYLAQDYIHRYLLAKPNLPRNCLQLLGSTALFVASKMEEIYPPRLEQFAFVTDGACTEQEILSQELLLIMTLNWNLTPVTVINWLNIYMQLAHIENGENFVQPGKFPKHMFVQMCQVLDLCTLDLDSYKFAYSVLSASVITYFISRETAMHVSGLGWDELLPCVTWLRPFVETIFEDGVTDLKTFNDVYDIDWHNIQTHSAGLKLIVMSTKRKFSEVAPSKEVQRRSKKSWTAVTYAIKYYEKGRYDKALPSLLEYEEVESRAIFLLAWMYLNGIGVPQDMNKAAGYMKKLVTFEGIRKKEKGLLALACYYLGDLYCRGVSVASDITLAVKHWRQGAVLKHPKPGYSYFGTMKCQTALGMFYCDSKVKKFKRAFYWHNKAVESGSIISEGPLGVMYMFGIGTEEDMQLAFSHLAKAAVMDNIYGKGYLAAFYYKRQLYHRTVTLSIELDALEDYEMLAERDDCDIEHVKQGIAVGCFYLALCFKYGYAVKESKSKSKKLIKKAMGISFDVVYDLYIKFYI